MYSLEHKNYLKEIKKENFLVKLFQILLLIIFIVLWQILSDLGIINTFISSSPKQVINTLIKLNNTNNLFIHIWTTIYETLISFSLGTLIGCVIAAILWWNIRF